MNIKFFIKYVFSFENPEFSIDVILRILILIFLLFYFIHHLKIKKKAYEIIFENTKWPRIIAKYPIYREFVISDILFVTPIWAILNYLPIAVFVISLIFPSITTIYLFFASILVWLIYAIIKDRTVNIVFRLSRYENPISITNYLLNPRWGLTNFSHRYLKKVIEKPDMLDYIYSEKNIEYLKKKL